MNYWSKWLVIFSMLVGAFGLAPAATSDANEPLPPNIQVDLQVSPQQPEIGKPVKVTVKWTIVGEIVSEPKLALLSEEIEMENVETKERGRYTNVTTGSFTPQHDGPYTISFEIKQKDRLGQIQVGTKQKEIQVIDPKKIALHVTPEQSYVQAGDEVPILITYKAPYAVRITYSDKVTVVYNKKVDGVYKILALYKVEYPGTTNLTITAYQSKNGHQTSKTVTINASQK